MKVLIYLRPKAEDFFLKVVKGVFFNPEIVTYSDYNHIADYWAGKYIYSEKYDVDNEEFEDEAADIIPRCRTLRKMEPNLAYHIARRYWNGMEEFFSQNHFDYLITIPVDCYSLDIICRIAEKKGVKIISFIGSPFAGHAKLTVRGEFRKVRDVVPECDIQRFVDEMTKTSYLSPSEIRNVKKNHWSIYRYHLRRMLIEHIYYPILKAKEHDPWNYHYNIFEVKGTPLKYKYNSQFEEKFTHIDELDIDPKSTVYYPMHLIPEATTDYWCEDVDVAHYDQFVLKMVTQADPGITFIIKEHPAMYGRRLLSFYDQLNSLPNVILLHPMDRSNNLLLQVDNVVVDNGTVGIEALMRGKRVLCLSDNYYCRFHPNAFRVDRVTKEALKLDLHDYDNNEFMRRLLEGCFPSDFRNSTDGIPASNPDQMIAGIVSYLKLNNYPR